MMTNGRHPSAAPAAGRRADDDRGDVARLHDLDLDVHAVDRDALARLRHAARARSVMCDATVSLLPRQRRAPARPDRAASRPAAAPGRPAGRIARSCATLNSSDTPPSSSATTSSSVISPEIRPLSSSTSAVVAAPLAQERQQAVGRHGLADAQDRPEQRRRSTPRPIADVVEHDVLACAACRST